MSARTELRDAGAALACELLDDNELGVALSFSNNGEAAVSLIGDAGPASLAESEEVGADIEIIRRVFSIPKQPNFPPDATAPSGGIRAESQITYESAAWTVKNVDDGGLGAIYELTAQRVIPVRLGGRS
jgi:hypothetical protein